MDLTTEYLGLTLKNPLVPSASPLSEDLNKIKRMEDAGAAAVVCYSLFEEEINRESLELSQRLMQGTDSFFEATTYFPELEYFVLKPENYLEHIRKAKQAVDIPVIGSVNGYSDGGWTQYAQLIQEAGADALELNIYFVPTDLDLASEVLENKYLNIVRMVRASVSIPVAVKISPFFTSIASLAKRLDDAGADGLVLFNRFYQPDIDLSQLQVVPNVLLSTPQAMRLPLRWIAILYGQLKANLAATSGIHQAEDVIKLVMAGADITQLCSCLFQHGIGHIRTILQGMQAWMEENDYESLTQMRGSMSQRSVEDPAAFERANYVKALRSYRYQEV
jgi:dihydroorotate dehydrogenase (fumarate)